MYGVRALQPSKGAMKESRPCRLVALVGVLSISLAAGYSTPAFAAHQADHFAVSDADSFLCYIETSSGSVVDLGRLCEQRIPPEILSTQDQQFLEEYLGLLTTSPTLDPRFAQAAQANPRRLLQTARDACNALRAGTEERFWRNERLVDRDILTALSGEYYCQEFAD